MISRTVKWAGHVACIGYEKLHTIRYLEISEVIYHLEDLRRPRCECDAIEFQSFEMNGTEVASNFRKARTTRLTIIYEYNLCIYVCMYV
jgi:hypothetical protein